MVKKLGLATVLAGALALLPCTAFAQHHGGSRSHSRGSHVSGRSYSRGAVRSYSGGRSSARSYSRGARYSGRRYYRGGHVRGGGRYYRRGHGSRFSIGVGFYSAPRYYRRGYYGYRYYPGPCDPPGFYDWEGYWHYYPGCAVVVYPPPYVAPYPY